MANEVMDRINQAEERASFWEKQARRVKEKLLLSYEVGKAHKDNYLEATGLVKELREELQVQAKVIERLQLPQIPSQWNPNHQIDHWN